MEKDQIAENLGEILGLNGQEVSEVVNAVLDESAQQMIEGLDDFDFDPIFLQRFTCIWNRAYQRGYNLLNLCLILR